MTATGVGLAGWSEAVSKYRHRFPSQSGTGLERYSSALSFVEVNVSFYRAVRSSTYESWASQTPDDFAFSVKMSRSVTHFAKLSEAAPLDDFWTSVAGLGAKLQAVLVQLPPSLGFDTERASAFFARMRQTYSGMIAVEPRHPSWASDECLALYARFALTPVSTAIPAGAPTREPSVGAPMYYRLHGEPRRYRSPYSLEQLRELSRVLAEGAGAPRFVCFDNTASSAGISNALTLLELLQESGESSGQRLHSEE